MKLLRYTAFTILLLLINTSLNAQDSEYNLDETYQIDTSGTVYLDSDDAQVSIQGSDRNDVHVVVYHRLDVDGWELKSGDKFKMLVEARNGNVYIREADIDRSRVLFGNVKEEYRITIEVPKTVALDIKGDDDSYSIADVNAAIGLNADDADVELRNTGGQNFSFDMDDGSVDMDLGQGELELNMDDGEFSVRQGSFTEIDAEVDDAQIDITTSLSNDGFYLFDMDDSDLELNITGGGGDFDIRHDDADIHADNNFEEVTSDEDHSAYLLPGGDAKIKIDTDDGDIELRTI